MPTFHQRSRQLEILDQTGIPFADIRQNMRELDKINTLLGGHRITLKGMASLLQGKPKEKTYRVLEIGCGDGNNLRVLNNWAAKKGYRLKLAGVDYNRSCIEYARQIEANKNICFTCSDYREAQLDHLPHIVFSSLFCHHFSDEDLVAQLRWMHQHSAHGFFINDLHRHPLAYHSIGVLTKLFSKSYLVKNDAPLSVLRGFSKKEWQRLLQQAGIEAASCRWMWAFRWLIVCRNE